MRVALFRAVYRTDSPHWNVNIIDWKNQSLPDKAPSWDLMSRPPFWSVRKQILYSISVSSLDALFSQTLWTVSEGQHEHPQFWAFRIPKLSKTSNCLLHRDCVVCGAVYIAPVLWSTLWLSQIRSVCQTISKTFFFWKDQMDELSTAPGSCGSYSSSFWNKTTFS